MNQVTAKLNKSSDVKNIESVEITVQLTPEQIIQAYQKLVKQVKKDWIYQKPYVSELKKRIKIANREKKNNQLIPASKLHKELGF